MKASHFGKGFLIVGILLGGCMMPPQVHPPMGDSVREIIARQIANPAAVDEIDNGTGMDGQAAEKSMSTYRLGFDKQSSQSSTSIIINQ